MDIHRFLELASVGRNGFWRYLVTFVIVMGFLVGASVVFTLVAMVSTYAVTGALPRALTDFNESVLFALSMFPFAFALGSLLLCVVLIHGRGPKTLITAAPRFRWRRFLEAMSLYLLLSAAADVVLALWRPGNYVLTFQMDKFVPLLLLSVPLIPIQTSTEELLFRAYLMQAFGRLTRRPVLPLLINALIFGLFHALNPEVAAYGAGIMAAYYVGFGILAGLLTLFTGGVELAIAMHLANNLYGSLFVTFPNSALPTRAIFTIQQFDPYVTFVVWVIVAAIFLIATVRRGEADWRGLWSKRDAGAHATGA